MRKHMSSALKPKIHALLEYLNHGLVERDAALKAALLAVLAGENMLLVGPPGTAKSFIARRVAESLAHEGHAAPGYFEYLLTKFSTPEEIFGPLSISELKADRFKRNTTGYLPTVRMAFLDEIFKASSSILNSLLTILNERIYHNGAEAQQVPMQALIAASNELPNGQEELEALYDRFLVRSFVDYVSTDNLPHLFKKPGISPALTPLTATDLAAIRHAAEDVTLSDEVLTAIQRICAEHKEVFKEDRRERISDRRLKKAVDLLRVSAATNGRNEVDLSDLLLLKDCLWNHPENAPKLHKILKDTLRSFSRPVPLSEAYTGRAEAGLHKIGGHDRPAQRTNLFKDYDGAGTVDDPILIKNMHDLAGLERPEVGQQGYHFLQTMDIDCSSLSSWPSILFKGHYDGAGFAIIGMITPRLKKRRTTSWLFSSILPESRLLNMRLQGLTLAKMAEGSHIRACKASGFLIAENAEKCVITECFSRDSLIGLTASSCIIHDCQADIYVSQENDRISSDGFFGIIRSINCNGAAKNLVKNSIVERFFISGKINKKSNFSELIYYSSIAETCEDSSIIKSALKEFSLEEKYNSNSKEESVTFTQIRHKNILFQHRSFNRARIVSKSIGNVTLEKNIALDAYLNNFDPTSNDGESIPATQFTQNYFEHNLGWDFERVWRWNHEKNEPELRHAGISAASQEVPDAAMYPRQGDLLTEQVRANLWL